MKSQAKPFEAYAIGVRPLERVTARPVDTDDAPPVDWDLPIRPIRSTSLPAFLEFGYRRICQPAL